MQREIYHLPVNAERATRKRALRSPRKEMKLPSRAAVPQVIQIGSCTDNVWQSYSAAKKCGRISAAL